jgi:hypothetical protein
MAADTMRNLQNRVAHGRWEFFVHLQLVAYVSGYPPGPQRERRFSLGELSAMVQDVLLLGNEVSRLPMVRR